MHKQERRREMGVNRAFRDWRNSCTIWVVEEVAVVHWKTVLMSTLVNTIVRKTGTALGFLAISTFAFAQTQDTGVPAQTGGFKRVGDPSQQSAARPNPSYGTDSNDPQYYPGGGPGPQQPQSTQNGDPAYQQQGPPPPAYGPQGPQSQGPYGQQGQPGPATGMQGWQTPNNGQPQYSQPPYAQPQYSQPPRPVPAQLTIKPGTFVTVRVNQPLSSDHNQAGDAFTATLVRPVVVDGVVVAERGETIGGRVTEADKGGRVKGVSRLGIQLTDLTLADGQQVPLQSQFISRKGSTSVGRDAAAIGTTTAVGAAVGAVSGLGGRVRPLEQAPGLRPV